MFSRTFYSPHIVRFLNSLFDSCCGIGKILLPSTEMTSVWMTKESLCALVLLVPYSSSSPLRSPCSLKLPCSKQSVTLCLGVMPFQISSGEGDATWSSCNAALIRYLRGLANRLQTVTWRLSQNPLSSVSPSH